MGGTSSYIPPPSPILPAPILPAPVPVQILPATIANNEPSIFNKFSNNINQSADNIYNTTNNSVILIDVDKLKNCIKSSNNDIYNQKTCIINYIKSVNDKGQIVNLTQENNRISSQNIYNLFLNQEQLQKAINGNFTSYNLSTGNTSMPKISINVSSLQQCFSNDAGNCITQYVKGFDDNTNNFQSLHHTQGDITVDSGGNIINPQNFQLVETNNNVFCSVNTFMMFLLIIYLLILLIKTQ